jgi:hypothetical protein
VLVDPLLVDPLAVGVEVLIEGDACMSVAEKAFECGFAHLDRRTAQIPKWATEALNEAIFRAVKGELVRWACVVARKAATGIATGRANISWY